MPPGRVLGAHGVPVPAASIICIGKQPKPSPRRALDAYRSTFPRPAGCRAPQEVEESRCSNPPESLARAQLSGFTALERGRRALRPPRRACHLRGGAQAALRPERARKVAKIMRAGSRRDDQRCDAQAWLSAHQHLRRTFSSGAKLQRRRRQTRAAGRLRVREASRRDASARKQKPVVAKQQSYCRSSV